MYGVPSESKTKKKALLNNSGTRARSLRSKRFHEVGSKEGKRQWESFLTFAPFFAPAKQRKSHFSVFLFSENPTETLATQAIVPIQILI